MAAPVPKRDGARESAAVPARGPLPPRMQPIGGAEGPAAPKGPPPAPRGAGETPPPRAGRDAPAPRGAGETPPPRAGRDAPAPRGAGETPAPRAASRLGKAIFVAGNALAALSARLYSTARKRGAAAVDDFQGRPEHVRYRAYALGAYGLVFAATLVAQLYTANALGAYVRVKRVDIPETTEIFVRNDSGKPWTRLRLQLNGSYVYEQEALAPAGYVQLKAEAFSLIGADGRVSRAPRGMRIDKVAVDADQGHTDVELER